MTMYFLSELVGCIIFLAGGFAYGAQTTLKDTFVKKFNALECAFAWGASLALGVTVAGLMGGPAALNPAVALGLLIMGAVSGAQFGLLLLAEFLGAGAAVLIVWLFFFQNFKDTTEGGKRGIFAAYPVKKNLWFNFAQEFMASCMFIFILFMGLTSTEFIATEAVFGPGSAVANLVSGISVSSSAGTAVFTLICIIWIAFTYSNTGFSMNPMRSVFSSIWYTILPIQNKNDKVDWQYQLVVNVCGSTLGMVLGVVLALLTRGAIGA